MQIHLSEIRQIRAGAIEEMPIKFEAPFTPVETIWEGYLKVKIFAVFTAQTLDIQNLHIPYKLIENWSR